MGGPCESFKGDRTYQQHSNLMGGVGHSGDQRPRSVRTREGRLAFQDFENYVDKRFRVPA
jgi:hypothetical protein